MLSPPKEMGRIHFLGAKYLRTTLEVICVPSITLG